MVFLEVRLHNIFSATRFIGLQTTVLLHKPRLSWCWWSESAVVHWSCLCSLYRISTYTIQIKLYQKLLYSYCFTQQRCIYILLGKTVVFLYTYLYLVISCWPGFTVNLPVISCWLNCKLRSKYQEQKINEWHISEVFQLYIQVT